MAHFRGAEGSVTVDTHDNGGRPFIVRIADTPLSSQSSVRRMDAQVFTHQVVDIYLRPLPVDDSHPGKPKPKRIKTYKDARVFIPKGYSGDRPPDPSLRMKYPRSPSDDGNSVLIQLSKPLHRYAFVGWDVYEFTCDGPVQKYFSLVGGSDVPYPVAVTRKYAYFMLDKKRVRLTDMPSTSVATLLDAYAVFYGRSPPTEAFEDVRVIHQRP